MLRSAHAPPRPQRPPHHRAVEAVNRALVAFGGDVVDIAQGLGDEVTVVGLSGGGAVTGLAESRRAAT
ncbi:MAG: hypothetical protein R2873_28735 [Caldilineaceae bacterium]